MKTQLIQTRSIPSAPNRLGMKAESSERFQLFESPVTKLRKGAEAAPIPKEGPSIKNREPVKSERPADRPKPIVKSKFNDIERPVDQKQYASDHVASPLADREPIAWQKPVSSETDQELVAEAPQEVSENAQALFVQMEQAVQGAVVPTTVASEALDAAQMVATEALVTDASNQALGKHGSMQMAIEAISKKLEGDGLVNPVLEGKFEALLTKLEGHASAHEAHQERLATTNADSVKLDKMLSAYGAELVHLSTAAAGKAQLTATKVNTALEGEQTLEVEMSGPNGASTVASLKDGISAIKTVADQLLVEEQFKNPSGEEGETQTTPQKSGESRGKDAANHSANMTIDADSVIGASIAGDTSSKAIDQALVLPEHESTQKTDRESAPEVKEVTGSAKHGTSWDGAKNGGISDLNQSDIQLNAVKEKAVVQHKISPSAIMEQVREAILKAPLQQGERTEMVLQLRPEELGKVELKIEVHKDVVIAKFDVASTMVKETIETNLADLKSSLKDKGFSDMTFDVNVSKERTHEGHGSQGGSGKRRGRSLQALESMHQKQSVYMQPSLAKLVGDSQFEHYA